MGDPAYGAALRYLGRRDHFRSELAEKLRRKGFEEDAVEAALDRCEGANLLDDERLAGRFAQIRSEANGWGPRRIEAELRRRGVARGIAEEAARLDPDRLRSALATALRRAQIRAPDGWWRVSARRARMVSSLIARGFAADDAIGAVDSLAESREKSDHAFDDESGNP